MCGNLLVYSLVSVLYLVSSVLRKKPGGGGGGGGGHSLFKGIRGCAAVVDYAFTSSGIY